MRQSITEQCIQYITDQEWEAFNTGYGCYWTKKHKGKRSISYAYNSCAYPNSAATTGITYVNVPTIYQYPTTTSDQWYYAANNAYGQLAGNSVYWQNNSGLWQCMVNGVGSLLPESAEEQAARMKAEKEREEKRKAASLRAENLLFSILTPIQVKQYQDKEYFDVEIKGRTYRIRRGVSRNIELIEAGKPVARYCAHPENAYETPVPDAMLAQFLMLQSNEAEFLRIANKTVLQ